MKTPKIRMDFGIVHVDDDGVAHVIEATSDGWYGQPRACSAHGTRAFALGHAVAVARPARPFSEVASLAHHLGDRGRVVCQPDGVAVVTKVVVPPSRAEEPTVVESRCAGARCVEERVAIPTIAPLVPLTDRVGTTIAASIDAASVEHELVVVVATDGAGVGVVRAPASRLADAAPVLLVDDRGAPTRDVRLITDGRGIVLLLDDGHRVRALRQRPDGSWVPQVAATD